MSALVLAAKGQPTAIVASDWLPSRLDAATQFIDSVTWALSASQRKMPPRGIAICPPGETVCA